MSKKIGVFVCHCGTNISATVDVEKVAEEAKTASKKKTASKAALIETSKEKLASRQASKETLIEEAIEGNSNRRGFCRSSRCTI